MAGLKREARLRVRPGHPRLSCGAAIKTWMQQQLGYAELRLSKAQAGNIPLGITGPVMTNMYAVLSF
jgi:hypothetical protein